ncbi:MAG: S-layer homology domain-containing protein [Clostridiales bacterium]|nr:S-layer homology domain-containing protein [Clostridiales bacterium]
MKKNLPGQSLSILLTVLLLLPILPAGLRAETVAGAADLSGALCAMERQREPEAQAEAPAEPAMFAFSFGESLLPTADQAELMPLGATVEDMEAKVEEAVFYLTHNHYYRTSDDWAAIALAAGGNAENVAGKSILDRYREMYTNPSTPMTEYEKAVIALSALGVNARRVYSGSDGVYWDFVAKFCDRDSLSQLNDIVFALTALHSGGYDSGGFDSGGYKLQRDTIIEALLAQELPSGGWPRMGGGPDMTAMAITTLSPYYDSRPDVKAAVDRGIAMLSNEQQSDGGFPSGNADALSQTIIALSAMGVDAHTDPGFVKGGESLLDALFRYQTSDGLFGSTGNVLSDPISTEQAFRALTAYKGFRANAAGDGKYNLYNFGPQTGDGTALTGETDPGKPVDPGESKNVTVIAINLVTGETLIPATAVSAAGTHMAALEAALTALGYDPADASVFEADDTAYGRLLRSVLGVAADTRHEWYFALNDASPPFGADSNPLLEGDFIVFYYTGYDPDTYSPSETIYIPAFDSKEVSVRAGASVTFSLTGLDSDSWFTPPAAPISGARVFVIDEDGREAGAGLTDAAGRVSVSFPTEGVFRLCAEKAGVLHQNILVPAQTTVTVGNLVRVRAVDLLNDRTMMKETAVVVRGNQYDALLAAMIANGINPAVNAEISAFGYVQMLFGLSGPTTAWMYVVNGEDPSLPINGVAAGDGDELLLYYIDWTELPPIGHFDRRQAEITIGDSVHLVLTATAVDLVETEPGVSTPVSTTNPVKGATVYALNASGAEVGETVTDEQGEASIILPSTGVYTISARLAGKWNQNNLVPPVCTVTVNNRPGESGEDLSVTLTVRGDSAMGLLIPATRVDMAMGANALELLLRVLDDRGISYSCDLATGYLQGINGLYEFNNGPSSGWMIRVNGILIPVNAENYPIKEGDSIFWFYSDDGSTEPGAIGFGEIEEEEEQESVVSEVKVNASVSGGGGGPAVARISGASLAAALQDAIQAREDSGGGGVAEVKLSVSLPAGSSRVLVEIRAGDLKGIASGENVRLSIESRVAAFSLRAEDVAGLIQGLGEDALLSFIAESVDPATLDAAGKAIVGEGPVFSLSLMAGDRELQGFNGSITVFLPYVPDVRIAPASLTVYRLGEDGLPVPMENVRFDASRGGYVFSATRFSLFFIAASGLETAAEEWANPFTDVRRSNWYFDPVRYAHTHGFMTGTAVDTFSPAATLTRGMVVSVLYRMQAVVPGNVDANPFRDVDEGQWYAEPVMWAAANGVVSGYGDSLFGPADAITREQMVAMLYNYCKWRSIDVSVGENTNILSYEDAFDIGEYAIPAFQWACGAGVIVGKPGGYLDPKGNATRAEFAAVLMRLNETVLR